jgi:hypothetical protein
MPEHTKGHSGVAANLHRVASTQIRTTTQQFGMQARDVVYVTNAPLYE